jgi:hypothetical protein
MLSGLATLLFLVACREEPRQTGAAHPGTGTRGNGTQATVATQQATTTIPADLPATASAIATEPPACTPRSDRLCPVDQGASDPSFVAFRKELADAVRDKNEEKLMLLVDPQVRTSFGGDGGAASFRRSWRTSSPHSPLWSELRAILQSGGSFQGNSEERSFWAPYVYSSWPDAYDAFEYVAALGPVVSLRSKAGDHAPVVTTLDWRIVKLMPETKENSRWRHVRTTEGKEGWVKSDDVRSPIAYRAGFSKRRGKWLMDALVSGD